MLVLVGVVVGREGVVHGDVLLWPGDVGGGNRDEGEEDGDCGGGGPAHGRVIEPARSRGN